MQLTTPILEQSISEYETTLQHCRDIAAPVIPLSKKTPGLKVPARYERDLRQYRDTTDVDETLIRQLTHTAFKQFTKKHDGFAFITPGMTFVQVENILCTYNLVEFQFIIQLNAPVKGWAESAGIKDHEKVQAFLDQHHPMIRTGVRIYRNGTVEVIGTPRGVISEGSHWQANQHAALMDELLPVFVKYFLGQIVYDTTIQPMVYHYIFKMPTFRVHNLHTGLYNLVFLDNELRRLYQQHYNVPYHDNDAMEIRFKTLKADRWKDNPLYKVEKAIAVKEDWRGKDPVVTAIHHIELIRY